MQQKNIADYILYDIAKKRMQSGLGITSEIISEVVEGWNSNIYVVPTKNTQFENLPHPKINLM